MSVVETAAEKPAMTSGLISETYDGGAPLDKGTVPEPSCQVVEEPAVSAEEPASASQTKTATINLLSYAAKDLLEEYPHQKKVELLKAINGWVRFEESCSPENRPERDENGLITKDTILRMLKRERDEKINHARTRGDRDTEQRAYTDAVLTPAAYAWFRKQNLWGVLGGTKGLCQFVSREHAVMIADLTAYLDHRDIRLDSGSPDGTGEERCYKLSTEEEPYLFQPFSWPVYTKEKEPLINRNTGRPLRGGCWTEEEGDHGIELHCYSFKFQHEVREQIEKMTIPHAMQDAIIEEIFEDSEILSDDEQRKCDRIRELIGKELNEVFTAEVPETKRVKVLEDAREKRDVFLRHLKSSFRSHADALANKKAWEAAIVRNEQSLERKSRSKKSINDFLADFSKSGRGRFRDDQRSQKRTQNGFRGY